MPNMRFLPFHTTTRHRITQKTIEKGGESGDVEVVCMLLMRPGEKGHVVCGSDPNCTGKSCIVTAEFDKGTGCTAGRLIVGGVGLHSFV